MAYETTFTFRIKSDELLDYKEYAKRGIINGELMSEALRLTFAIVKQELKLSPKSSLYDELVVKNYKLRQNQANQTPSPIVETDNTKRIEIKSDVTEPQPSKQGLDLSWLKIKTNGEEV